VYQALATIDGLSNWWTKETTGDSKTGGVLEFRFGGQYGTQMKVTESKPNELIEWVCVGGFDDWVGTTVSFKLDENEGKTRVRFGHNKWKETEDNFAACSFSWAKYMESLRQLCQIGKGEAFGSDTYRK
jgi:uncharacterized protein YndB with AHSA1/START domain